MNRNLITIAATWLLVAFIGCDNANSDQSSKDSLPTQQAQSNQWLLSNAPQDAISITQARLSAKEGDTVVIRGRIGGRKSPVSDESPVFTVVDLGVPYCGQFEEDGCGTPWDYCCESPDTIIANSATIQVEAEGDVRLVAAGLEALDEVILIGTVGPRPSDAIFTIRASGVFLADE